MRGEKGKETPKKELDNRRIFKTSHMPLFAVPNSELDNHLHFKNRINIRNKLFEVFSLCIKTWMTKSIKSAAQKNHGLSAK